MLYLKADLIEVGETYGLCLAEALVWWSGIATKEISFFSTKLCKRRNIFFSPKSFASTERFIILFSQEKEISESDLVRVNPDSILAGDFFYLLLMLVYD